MCDRSNDGLNEVQSDGNLKERGKLHPFRKTNLSETETEDGKELQGTDLMEEKWAKHPRNVRLHQRRK